MPDRLGIHVIGPRLGESIVIELPDGGVGVIDSFASRRGSHPVVGFLKKRLPHISELRFFAVTHPHADHCYRATEVVENFPPKEAWIFRPFPLGQVQEYYKALYDLGRADRVEKALGLPPGSMAISLLQFEAKVGPLIKSASLKYRPLALFQSFDCCKLAVRVHFLTPGSRHQYAYSDQLKKVAEAIARGGRKTVPDDLPDPDHNLASCGVVLEYGASRVLLMADAENKLWDEWFETSPDLAKWKPIHFLKAAHHGSPNGYHAKLYTGVADPATTIAVITPFNQGSVHLPTEGGVQSLRPHVKAVYTTNRTIAASSTGLPWKRHSSVSVPSLPSTWAVRLRKTPGLAKLVVPEAGLRPPAGGRTPALPAEWVVEARNKPALWRLIRPEYRLPLPGPAPAEDYAVSAYLDDKGAIVNLRTGEEAGVLDL